MNIFDANQDCGGYSITLHGSHAGYIAASFACSLASPRADRYSRPAYDLAGRGDWMVDFERARVQMVESQLRGGGVTAAPILSQMRAIRREDFVAAERREVAYVDDIQWLGSGRFMAAPATLAKLLKLAEITGDDTVLDIGAATGYSTAIIAGLAHTVVGLEADPTLAATAAANLVRLGLDNASIVAGTIAQIGSSRFDVIMVQGALDAVPDAFVAALSEGGRLVALIRSGGVCVAHIFVKTRGSVKARADFNAFLPPLYISVGNEEFVF